MPPAFSPQIRRAKPDEVPALTELALRSKAHWGYDAVFMQRCRDELTIRPDDIASNSTFVAEEAGTLLGFCMLEWISEQRMELSFLFVEPAAIGRGVGRLLIDRAAQHGRDHGARHLEILGDPHAMAFYRAAGARQIGERPSASIPGRVLPLLEVDLEDDVGPGAGASK